ncbi:P-loop containing nucleoside triphosphate hydrolase protein [Pisolithus thermaeus]|nr:P-loop containing nucleoside triphosphate hydrolase protein [Pisolithus croceorrhizus]KAI6156466.1 P-loop containing nucleoside triphosphate hydrolase protein [Pisolithus thermaeus]
MVAYNIVFAGEAGVGKSSLIDLLLDLEVSEASNRVFKGAAERKRAIAIQDRNVYRLWNTPGLDKGTRGHVPQRQAAKILKSLIKELMSGDGVHLVVFCFQFTEVPTNSLRKVYEAALASVHGIQVPVIAAVVRADEIMQISEDWWSGAGADRKQKGMTFAAYACVPTLQDMHYPPMLGRRIRAKEDLWQLIKQHAVPLLPPDFPPKKINIILLGQTGVGKSSLVNLIAGQRIADVSPDADVCTKSPTEYRFEAGVHDFRIWDTTGLEEPEGGVNGYTTAISKTLQLIRRLAAAGGVNLLLLCMKGPKVTRATQGNYRLFYEILCEEYVPVGLVITHLEREDDMEEWWGKNKKTLDGYGVRSVGHACVTGLPSCPKKYAPSRAAIYGLLTDCDRFGKYNMPPDIWLKRLAKSNKSLIIGAGRPKGEKLTQALVTRCGLKEEDARELRKLFEEEEVDDRSLLPTTA